MKKLLLAVALALAPLGAFAQTAQPTAIVVTTCGATSPAAAFVAGRSAPLTVDTTGKLCSSSTATGNVVGPSSTHDNDIVQFDGTTGKLIKGQGATLTTSAPALLNQVWNAAGVTFTGLLVNPSGTSATGSLIADFQFGSVSQIAFRKDGAIRFTASGNIPSLVPVGQFLVLDDLNAGYNITFGTKAVSLTSAGSLGWVSGSDPTVAADTILARDAANTLALRNGVNAQVANLYETWTDASNYSRLKIDATGSSFSIYAQAAGTGTARPFYIGTLGAQSLNFVTNGSLFWAINSTGLFQGGGATSSFPALKRSSAVLIARLADDSADATFQSAQLIASGIASDATHTDATVCVDTTSKQFYSGSGAVGICLGTSSVRYKTDIAPLAAGLSDLTKLQPVTYRYIAGYGDPAKTLYGFTAEQVDTVLPQLVGLDLSGQPNSVDWAGLVPVIVNAIKELKGEVDQLKAGVH